MSGEARAQGEVQTVLGVPEDVHPSPVRARSRTKCAVAINARPKAVVQLCVNLGKRVNEYLERANASPQGKLSADLCDRARVQIAGIARNAQFCSSNGTREGGVCTLTFADFDRLANWLYIFT
jgi:hypothetical protein